MKRIGSVFANVTLPGCMLTETCGKIVMLDDALFVLSTWLVAVITTGFGEGIPSGAT
jgi:hypothetical protein